MRKKTKHRVRISTDSVITVLKNIIAALRSSGHILIYIVSDPQKQWQLDKAGDAFSALNEIVWGEFYKNHIKHNTMEVFKTPEDAIRAYRDYITDVIVQHKLHQED